MSLLDDLLGAAQGGVNQVAGGTIGDARSGVSLGLTNLLNSALPNVNKIPGAGRAKDAITGALLQQVNNASGVPTQIVGNGVQQVFDAIGVSLGTKVADTNPRIYANGVSAATGVWSDIASGNSAATVIANASEPLSLLKYTDANLPTSVSSASPPPTARYSPYAMDLFRLAPKHKFLYVVQFIFNGTYDFIGKGPESQNQFALVIQEFERPKIKYEYEDNVSYYNFRTKIVKRVVHDPLSIKFLDDRQNLSMTFFHEYLKATHPITNVGPESSAFYESNGMNFSSPLNSSSTSSLQDNFSSILKEIKVYHLYDFGAKMNTYHFMNPKIVSVELDNWAMHDSDGSNIMAQFGYDGMYVELGTVIDAATDATVGTLSNAGQYPLHPRQQAGAEVSQSLPVKAISSLGGDDPLGAFILLNNL